jgi:hypothetical protein
VSWVGYCSVEVLEYVCSFGFFHVVVDSFVETVCFLDGFIQVLLEQNLTSKGCVSSESCICHYPHRHSSTIM